MTTFRPAFETNWRTYRGTDAETHSAYKDWIRRLFMDDRSSRDWFYFVLNADLPTTTDTREFYRHVSDSCHRAMKMCDPRFPMKHPRRYDPQKSISVLWTPAVKRDVAHLHGWIRVNDVTPQEITIRDNRTDTTITAPRAVGALVEAFRTSSKRRWKAFATDNIFVRHEQGHAVAETDDSLTHALDYLAPARKERRLYRMTDAAPRWTFTLDTL